MALAVSTASAPPGQPGGDKLNGLTRTREGYEDTEDVLRRMAELVKDYRSNPSVRDAAAGIVRPVDEQDPGEVARAVWRWVIENVQYVLDPAGVELLQSPDVTLDKKFGDCDDLSVLAASLLSAVGVDAGFRAVAQVEAGEYDHVYVIYWAGESWREMDAIDAGRPPPGPIYTDAKSTLNTYINADMPNSSRGRDLKGPRGMGISIGGTGTGYSYNPGGGGYSYNPGGGGSRFDFSNVSWKEILESGIEITPEIIRAFRDGGGGGGGRTRPPRDTGRPLTYSPPYGDNQAGDNEAGVLGMDSSTLLIGGGVAAGLLFIYMNG